MSTNSINKAQPQLTTVKPLLIMGQCHRTSMELTEPAESSGWTVMSRATWVDQDNLLKVCKDNVELGLQRSEKLILIVNLICLRVT